MFTKNLCPCCSQPLLRHISCKRTFWFCNHCYQEMPVLSHARDIDLAKQHWLNKPLLERQKRQEQLPQLITPSTVIKPKKDLQRLACLDNLNRILLDETIPHPTKIVDEKKSHGQHNHKPTARAIHTQCDDSAATTIDLLKSYVAYYVSRGNRIMSPLHDPLQFFGSVYQYWGYHEAFQKFWRQLTSRRDFLKLYIEGDVYCFGQALNGNFTVGGCARCNLPIPLPEGNAYNVPNCTLCDVPKLSLQGCDDHQSQYYIVAIGTSPIDQGSLEEWFSKNNFQVTFVCNPEDLQSPSLPSKVDLVLIYSVVSEIEGKAWASELTCYSQFQGVPIVALSTKAGGGLPWMEETLKLEDYLLSPQGGDRLVHHLRQLIKPQLKGDTPDLYWFPC